MTIWEMGNTTIQGLVAKKIYEFHVVASESKAATDLAPLDNSKLVIDIGI
jgi:hypothetical protein